MEGHTSFLLCEMPLGEKKSGRVASSICVGMDKQRTVLLILPVYPTLARSPETLNDARDSLHQSRNACV